MRHQEPQRPGGPLAAMSDSRAWWMQWHWNYVLSTSWGHGSRCRPCLLAQLDFISPQDHPDRSKNTQWLLNRPVTVPPGRDIPTCWCVLERERCGTVFSSSGTDGRPIVERSCRNGDPLSKFRKLDVYWRRTWKFIIKRDS